MKKELDRSKRYNFSDIQKETEEKVLKVIKNSSSMPWDIKGFNVNRKEGSLKFECNDWYFQSNFGKDDLTFEPLLDLEDVQVDCNGLTDEEIKEMADVFEANGYKIWDNKNALIVNGDSYLLEFDTSEVFVSIGTQNKTTITYDKFMELFGEPKKYIQMVGRMKQEDNKTSLLARLKSLEETRQKTIKEIEEVRKELKSREKVLMFMVKKGIPTFVLQNISQKYNLEQNGWKEISKEELIKEIEKYD